MIIFSTVTPYLGDFPEEKYKFKFLNVGSFFDVEKLNIIPMTPVSLSVRMDNPENFDSDYIHFYSQNVLNNHGVVYNEIIPKVLIPHMSGEKVIILIPSCDLLMINIFIDYLYKVYGIDSYMASDEEELYGFLLDNKENFIDFEGLVKLEEDISTYRLGMGVERWPVQHLIHL